MYQNIISKKKNCFLLKKNQSKKLKFFYIFAKNYFKLYFDNFFLHEKSFYQYCFRQNFQRRLFWMKSQWIFKKICKFIFSKFFIHNFDRGQAFFRKFFLSNYFQMYKCFEEIFFAVFFDKIIFDETVFQYFFLLN